MIPVVLSLFVAGAPAGVPSGIHQASPADFDFEHAWQSPCVPTASRGPDPKFATECAQMSEPQYFHGIWRAEFEVSNFTFMGRKDCFEADDQSCVDLVGKGLPDLGQWSCARLFEVEFIGRRSRHAVMEYGSPAYLVEADRLISAKRLPDPYDQDCDPKLHPELQKK